MKNNFQALGRLKQGVRNKTEAEYEQRLELLKKAGEILWYRFESVNLRLADSTFYKPDFLVMDKDCSLAIHEIKGSYITDDAKTKLKIAADMYPFKFLLCQKKNKQWEITEI